MAARLNMSAGVMPFRRMANGVEVLLAHPGGPFWARKDEGAWTIVKGELGPGESGEAAARREFEEETGLALKVDLIPLGSVKQAAGKVVAGFAAEFDCDPATIVSNMFEIEWPPRSGRRASFPEIDRACWFTPDKARTKINPAQVAFIDRLLEAISAQA